MLNKIISGIFLTITILAFLGTLYYTFAVGYSFVQMISLAGSESQAERIGGTIGNAFAMQHYTSQLILCTLLMIGSYGARTLIQICSHIQISRAILLRTGELTDLSHKQLITTNKHLQTIEDRSWDTVDRLDQLTTKRPTAKGSENGQRVLG